MGNSEIKNKAIFFDRDGVLNAIKRINNKPFPPDNVDELELFPDVRDKLKFLKKLGFYLFLVTNQPDYKRGKQLKKNIVKINSLVKSFYQLDDTFTCWHAYDGQCECRKPKPGMIINASLKYKIYTSKSFMIGDRWKDIEAGNKAGCRSIFLDYNYDEKKPDKYDYSTNSIQDSIDWIIKNSN